MNYDITVQTGVNTMCYHVEIKNPRRVITNLRDNTVIVTPNKDTTIDITKEVAGKEEHYDVMNVTFCKFVPNPFGDYFKFRSVVNIDACDYE